MMKWLVLAILAFSTYAEAILPPVWQGVSEIKAILNDKRLESVLDSGEILEGIEKKEGGWQIKTNKTEVFVKVVQKPQSMPGPMPFDLEFTKPVPLQNGSARH